MNPNIYIDVMIDLETLVVVDGGYFASSLYGWTMDWG